jgi:hypothetical protein
MCGERAVGTGMVSEWGEGWSEARADRGRSFRR